VFAELKLTEDTQDKIQSERRSVMSSIRSQMTAGGDRSQFAQLMSSKIPAIFKKHLTAEQYAQYQAISDNREEVRRGTAWIKDEEGNVRPQSVRLGIADSAFTEVLGGGLQEGADVVTRVRQMTN
jgi:hypothetical protein